jgi:two-component system chemotaxis sensor kinase CheA
MSGTEEELAIVQEFLTESREHIEQFEAGLLALESDPTSGRLLASLFRGIHSIKGSCSFLGYTQLEALTHAGETVLGELRSRRLAFAPELVAVLLGMVDGIRRLLSSIEATGQDGAHAPLIGATIARLAQLVSASAERGEAPAGDGASEESAAPTGGDAKIRVDVGVLDRLMNLVGELVLARNQIVQVSAAHQAVAASAQRLNLVTTELQEGVMKTRMQPIGNVWSRFPRLVRDVAKACGKQVRLQLEGRDTELDKTIIEAIQDPLTHLVRNAVDHGIETLATRRARGKAEEGAITLRAFHEGGMVNIEVSDDGAGVDLEAVKKKALEGRLSTPEQLGRMTEREVLGLLFLPGFSTAGSVTSVSGRGVGMDVVKTNIEKIGGSVDVQSTRGLGTTFRIKIPLTLAIIPALIVTSGRERYAIAQASLLEVVRLEGAEAKQRLDSVQGAPVFRLRGKLLPLTYLDRELGRAALPARPDADDAITIVVLQADDRSFGLVVDAIQDTEEIVVKPLWKRLKGIACYAGATVMGDGRVALILDAIGLAQRVGVVSDARGRAPSLRAEPEAAEPGRSAELVLVCQQGGGRLAIPLAQVARLEELAAARVERAGGTEVVQYRGQILPLVRLASLLRERRERPRDGDAGAGAAAEAEMLSVVVFARQDRSLGLVVEGILDIVEVRVELQRQATRPGIAGSMVVFDRVTEFLDVEGALRLADSTLVVASSASAELRS